MRPSLAIAHSMKRNKKKCASGGTVESGDVTMNMSEGGEAGDGKHREDHEKGVHRAALKEAPGMSSSGLLIDRAPHSLAKTHAEVISKGMHENKLDELKEMPSPKLPMAKGDDGEVTCPHCSNKFSHGGEVDDEDHADTEPDPELTGSGEQSEDHEKDMVHRVMDERRSHHKRKMSKGGEVANTDLPVADFEPNEFDDLHLRDDLESNYTGANSGDEISNPNEDKRRKDVVAMVMASRRKRPSRA